MSAPGYDNYRESGIEWLGQVPSHWTIEKFRHRFRESSEKIETDVVGPMLSVSGYRGIEIKEYDDENRRRRDDELVGYRIVRPGQLVVNTMWLNYAGLGVSAHEGHVSPAYRSYWIRPGLEGRYAHHLMRSSIYVQGYTRLLTGIRPNSLQMSRDDLMEFPVVVPPLAEQAAIAAFLDRETGKIDALVEAQTRLIELLKEKRQAVISHAVTKGLDPAAPMKNSGIEWLDQVPAHWEVKPIKAVASYNDDILTEATPPDHEIAYVEISDVQAGVGIAGSTAYAFSDAPSRARRRVQCGDIIVSTVRTYLRAIAAVTAPADNMIVSTGFAVIRPRAINSRFIGYALLAEHTINEIIARSVGISYPAINASDLVRIPVSVPPLAEQVAIATFLDRATAKIDALLNAAEEAIALLQERRAALIAAAVTGKIDVRRLAPQQAEAA